MRHITGRCTQRYTFCTFGKSTSFLLEKVEGYKIKKTSKQINHAFFVDDLKLFAESMNIMKLLLDIITTYSRDIEMKFGKDKCAYILTRSSKEHHGSPYDQSVKSD